MRFWHVQEPSGSKEGQFVRRTLIVVAIVAGALLLWEIRAVLVLIMGSILVATIVRSIADPIEKHLRIPERLAVLTAVLLIVGAIAGTTWLIGAQVAAQGEGVARTLPGAAKTLDAWLSGLGLGHPAQQMLARLHSAQGVDGRDLTSIVSRISLGVAGILILFFGGIFLAAQPRLYGIGVLKLFPPAKRALVAEALEDSERALRLWLKGQLMAMILVGVMTLAGLWLLGVPSPLALALIAGVLEFIPYAGAITSAIPAIMVALGQSPDLAVWTIVLYVIVHHVEAYLIQPLIQQFAVEIPAVLTLFSLLASGLLFGIPGVLLAAPIAVVAYVLVKRLYVIEALDTPTPIPGAGKDAKQDLKP